jgi:hypothetical protein
MMGGYHSHRMSIDQKALQQQRSKNMSQRPIPWHNTAMFVGLSGRPLLGLNSASSLLLFSVSLEIVCDSKHNVY